MYNINILRYFGAFLLCVNYTAYAAYNFDPAFLASDPSAVADLSHFQAGSEMVPGKYKVDVYVNGNKTASHEVDFVAKSVKGSKSEELKPVFTTDQLHALGIRTENLPALKNTPPTELVSVDNVIPDATSTPDLGNLRVDLSIPQIAMRNDARGYIPPEQWDQGITALLLNYNLTGNKDWYDSGSAESNFLSLQSGINFGPWRLRDTSTWDRNAYTSGNTTSEWKNINTFIERNIESLKGELTAGDTSTRSDIFDSYPLRGMKLESDENMLPDSQRGFAPTIRGIARGNAKVTIRQNNYVLYQTYVPAGAFEINDLFPTSTSGDLQVTITEADGTNRTFTVPYSSVPGLQREGHLLYATSVGQYHSDSSMQDEPEVAQGTFFWGIGNGYTLYGGSQISDKYKSIALGMGDNLGSLGAISVDLTAARSTLSDDSTHSGESMRFLYAKSLNELGTTVNLTGYRYSTSGFYTFSDTTYKIMSGYDSPEDNSLDDRDNKDDEPDYANYYNLWYTKKGKLQVSINQSLDHWGSFYLSATEQTYWHTDEKDEYLQAGFNSNIKDISYSINYSYNKYMDQPDKDQMVSLNISLPIGKWLSRSGGDINHSNSGNAYLTYGSNTDNDGHTTQMAGLSGTLLEDGNLNYSIQQGYGNQGDGASGNASLGYRGTYNNLNLGYNYSDDSHQVNYGVAGGIVLHRNGLTFSQPLGDTNILVAAPGAAGVDVENNAGVKTDWRGYAVIPYASTYKQNRVALDTSSLDNHTDIGSSVVDVVPTPGALVQANFSTRTGERVLMTLMHDGKPLPFGAMVTGIDHHDAGIVGDDGQVYLPGLSSSGNLLAQWGSASSQQCKVAYAFPEQKEDVSVVRMTAQCE